MARIQSATFITAARPARVSTQTEATRQVANPTCFDLLRGGYRRESSVMKNAEVSSGPTRSGHRVCSGLASARAQPDGRRRELPQAIPGRAM